MYFVMYFIIRTENNIFFSSLTVGGTFFYLISTHSHKPLPPCLPHGSTRCSDTPSCSASLNPANMSVATSSHMEPACLCWHSAESVSKHKIYNMNTPESICSHISPQNTCWIILDTLLPSLLVLHVYSHSHLRSAPCSSDCKHSQVANVSTNSAKPLFPQQPVMLLDFVGVPACAAWECMWIHLLSCPHVSHRITRVRRHHPLFGVIAACVPVTTPHQYQREPPIIIIIIWRVLPRQSGWFNTDREHNALTNHNVPS